MLAYLPTVFASAYASALLVLGGLSLSGQASPTLQTVFVAGLWGYGALAVINFYVMTVFGFRHCCVGMNSFWTHLRHSKPRLTGDATWSLLWPLNWYGTVRGLLGWGIDWIGVAIEPTVYWVSTWRRGHRMVAVSQITGKTEVIYYE